MIRHLVYGIQTIIKIYACLKVIRKTYIQNSETLISLGSDEFIFIWDVKQGLQIGCIQQSCRYYYHKIAFSSDGNFFAQQNENEIRIWEIKVGKIVNILEGQSNQRYVMALKPGASILATLSKKENKIKLWELNIQKSLGSYEGHKSQVIFIQFSPDYQKLSTWGKDQIWDVKKFKLNYQINLKTTEQMFEKFNLQKMDYSYKIKHQSNGLFDILSRREFIFVNSKCKRVYSMNVEVLILTHVQQNRNKQQFPQQIENQVIYLLEV